MVSNVPSRPWDFMVSAKCVVQKSRGRVQAEILPSHPLHSTPSVICREGREKNIDSSQFTVWAGWLAWRNLEEAADKIYV